MVTYEEYRFALEIVFTEAFEGLKWKDLPAWAREIINAATKVVDAWEQEEYLRQVAEDPDFFPF